MEVFMKEELESSIRNLNLQIKNLERLLEIKNSKFLRKMLISRKNCLRKLLLKYKKYVVKEQLVLKFGNFFSFNNIENNLYIKTKILRK